MEENESFIVVLTPENGNDRISGPSSVTITILTDGDGKLSVPHLHFIILDSIMCMTCCYIYISFETFARCCITY